MILKLCPFLPMSQLLEVKLSQTLHVFTLLTCNVQCLDQMLLFTNNIYSRCSLSTLISILTGSAKPNMYGRSLPRSSGGEENAVNLGKCFALSSPYNNDILISLAISNYDKIFRSNRHR